MKILLIQTKQRGDIFLTTPCISAIREAMPDAYIAFLCSEIGRPFVENHPHLDKYYLYGATFRSELAITSAIRKQKFDCVIDYMNNNRSALYTYASGAGIRVSYSGKRRFFYTHIIPRKGPARYIIEEKLAFLESIGITCKSAPLLLPWFESDAKLAHEFWLPSQTPRICISPTSRRVRRRWPLEYYAQIADYLSEKWGAEVVWLWGPGEKSEIEAVRALSGRGKGVCAPETSIRELAGLLAHADLFIGNSNGTSHVAVATNCPSIQIHGPTFARSWSPLNHRHRAVESPSRSIGEIRPALVIAELENLKPEVEKSAADRHRFPLKRTWLDMTFR